MFAQAGCGMCVILVCRAPYQYTQVNFQSAPAVSCIIEPAPKKSNALKKA